MSEEPPSLNNPVRLMRLMSHDMRGPLGTLTGTSDLFAEGVYGSLTPQQTRAVERIQRNSYRMLALLDDLMAYVKAEAGQFPLTAASFAPRTILAEVCQQIQEAARAKGITVQLHVEDTVPPELAGDEAVIRRMLLALLWNAVGFTPQGTLQIESGWLSDRLWQVTIRDSGPGIPAEDAVHIFEPFWRGAVRPPMPTSGFGLGLPMALAFARSMQGTLLLKETGPAGSTFCLQLPLPLTRSDTPAQS